MALYEITNSSEQDTYLSMLTAEQVLRSLIESGVKFVDTDGKRLKIKKLTDSPAGV